MILFVSAALLLSLSGIVAQQDSILAPSVPGFEALPEATLLRRSSLTLNAGYTTPPGPARAEGGGGAGNQNYFGGIGWGASDRLTVLFGLGLNDDPTFAPIRGEQRAQEHVGLALGVRTVIGEVGPVSIGLQAAAEVMWIASDPGLFNAGTDYDSAFVQGFALALPVTARLNSVWTATIVPSVARLPSEVMAAPYYGTMVRLGGGTRAQLSEAWSISGSAELPLGPGDSTLHRDGQLTRFPTWHVGIRFQGTRRSTFEARVTTAAGSTPARRHLTQLSSPVTLYSVAFRYSPTVRERPVDGAREPRAPLLAVGGITLPGAITLPPSRGRMAATIDSKGAVGVQLAWAFGRRLQFELLTARIQGPDAERIMERPIGGGYQYRFGPQLMLLDQAEGMPLSVVGRVTLGRDLEDQQGYLLGEAVAVRELRPGLALVLNPVFIQSGGRSLATVGVAARLPVAAFGVLPEWRGSLSGDPSVWALGLRLPELGRLLADVFLTNAGSTLGLGRLLADPDGARVGLTLNVAL